MRFLKPVVGLVLALGVAGGCSSSSPEEARAGACDGQSTCTVEELCSVAKCGGSATARFNADGCIRRNCTASSQCAVGEVCFLPGLVENTCLPSGRSCDIYEGRCTCSGTLDCGGGGLCVPEAEIPEETCVVPDDCASLKGRIENLEYSKFHGVFTPEEDVAERVDACLTEMRKRQIQLECDGAPCQAQVACSKESVCASETCGGPTARFDSEGCERQPCEMSSDCASDQVCFLPSLVADACVASVVEGCSEENGSCICSISADCSSSGFCIAASEVPADDCVVPDDCSALESRYQQLQRASADARSDLTDRINACLPKLYAKQQELACAGTKRACGFADGCLLDQLCALQDCGTATSLFDATGCVRTSCEQSADCGDAMVCFVPALVEDKCLPGGVEFCGADPNGTCGCNLTTDCRESGICLEVAEVPAEPCVVPDNCQDLQRRLTLLDINRSGAQGDLKTRIESCISEMQQKQQDLSCL